MYDIINNNCVVKLVHIMIKLMTQIRSNFPFCHSQAKSYAITAPRGGQRGHPGFPVKGGPKICKRGEGDKRYNSEKII